MVLVQNLRCIKVYFEGKPNYKLPVHNPSLRNTRSFRAVGRIRFYMVALVFHGLSNAVKHFACKKNKIYQEVHTGSTFFTPKM